MKEYELEKEILISTINHEKHLGDNLKIRVNKYIDYLEGLEEKIKKFYEGEIYTCKQLKNIEENQKKYFINKQVIRDKIEELKEQFKDYEERWSKTSRDKRHPFYKYLIRIESEIDILNELLEEE